MGISSDSPDSYVGTGRDLSLHTNQNAIDEKSLICQTVPYCGEEPNIKPSYNYRLDESNSKFEIYPNPTSKFLTIDKLSPVGSIVTLLDMTGRSVYEATVKQSKLIIDLSTLNTGIYYVLIQDLNGSFINKIIKS